VSATLAALSRRALCEGRSPLLGGEDGFLSTDSVLARIEQIARYLQAAGVHVLAIAADNSPDWVLTDLAAQRAGIPVVPVPPFFSAAQVEHVLADSGADAIAADEFGSSALMSLPTRFIGELTSCLSLLRLERSENALHRFPGTAKIRYTSGTTGTPKGVCLTRATLDGVATSLEAATRDAGVERHLCLLPLATLLENVAGVYAPIIAGAEIIVPSLVDTGLAGASGVNLERLIDCIEQFEPGSIILLPQLLFGLVGAAEQGLRLPESLRLVAVGGGVVGSPLLERADRAGIPVYEGYGLTECGSVVALNTPRARKLGSVGRPLPHARVRIAADGEILVAGAVMAGYLGESAEPTVEIATGDIGRIDGDGYLHISGRKKDVLITSFGRNVSPEWVEASLTAADSIAQAALFGDALPWLTAVIAPDLKATVADVERDVGLVNRSLPGYARVRRWILATEAFSPLNGMLTANGRLRRAAIERRYCNEIAACYAEAIEGYA
jgi:long-chain acyl-CoA synthetase